MGAAVELAGAERRQLKMGLYKGLTFVVLLLATTTSAVQNNKNSHGDSESMEQFDPAYNHQNTYGIPRSSWRSNQDDSKSDDHLNAIQKMPQRIPVNEHNSTAKMIQDLNEIRALLNPRPPPPSNFKKVGLGEFLDSLVQHSTTRPWWKGPNVCVSREEINDSDSAKTFEDRWTMTGFLLNNTVNIQTCYATSFKYECVQRIRSPSVSLTKTVRYQCCSGYLLRHENECEKVELQPLLETIKMLNASSFLLMANGIQDILVRENVTVFLPSNEAFRKYSMGVVIRTEMEVIRNVQLGRHKIHQTLPSGELIKAHITKGFKELCPDETYEGFNGSILRVKYVTTSKNEPEYLVNCARVTASNIYATNGMIHTIDRVLMPVTRTIMKEIIHSKEYTILRHILDRTGISRSLNSNEIWTLFAPTNKAFEKFRQNNTQLMEKILGGGPSARNLIKNHLLSYTFCSAAVELGALGVRNSLGEFLNLTRVHRNNDDYSNNGQSRFKVNDVLVTEVDLITTNGVIHSIDEILMPDSALPIMNVLEKNNLTLFAELIKISDMGPIMDNLSNHTIIIPTDEAIKNYIGEEREYKRLDEFFSGKKLNDEQKEELRSFIYRHIVAGAIPSDEMKQGMILKSKGYDEDNLYVNVYNTAPFYPSAYNRATIDCAKLVQFDMPQYDNIIHQVDRPLVPNNGTILDLVKADPNLSKLYKIIENTEIENILEIKDNITFAAPSNSAFERLPAADYDILLKRKSLTEALLKLQIVDGIVCSAGILEYPWPFVNRCKSITGQVLQIGNYRIGNSDLLSMDHVASNGVLHYSETFVMPSKSTEGEYKSPNVDIQLYGINI